MDVLFKFGCNIKNKLTNSKCKLHLKNMWKLDIMRYIYTRVSTNRSCLLIECAYYFPILNSTSMKMGILVFWNLLLKSINRTIIDSHGLRMAWKAMNHTSLTFSQPSSFNGSYLPKRLINQHLPFKLLTIS